MSDWQNLEIRQKIISILEGVPCNREFHHFGRPFMTAYQIAIEYARLHPEDLQHLKLPVGGAGTGERNTFAQYIAGELSRRISREGTAENIAIEGRFVSNKNVKSLSYDNNGETLVSSLTNTPYDLSMYRLRS